MVGAALTFVSAGLIIIGMTGFTASGLGLGQTRIVTGTSAKVVGTLCILAGLLVIPVAGVIYLVWTSR